MKEIISKRRKKLKANIKRKEAVTALRYIGCHYLANLIENRTLVCFDNEFFKFLNKEFLKSKSFNQKMFDEKVDSLQKQNKELQQELFKCQNIQRENEDLKLQIEILKSEKESLNNSESLSLKTQIQEKIYLSQQIEDMFNVPKE